MNPEIGRLLQEAHADVSGGRRGIRLPADQNIQFRKSGPDYHIAMSAAAVTANMQTNESAFEGWSLALRLWLGAQGVHLQWSPPDGAAEGVRDRHYSRFLYRVQRFAELFPQWFHIGSSEHLSACLVRRGEPLFLNVAGERSKEPAEPKPETALERMLVTQHAQKLCRLLSLARVDRQFPVGLYRTPDLRQPVFTGGTSAIDIVGVGPDAFTVIELKARSNIAVGALGELLFYASVVRDAAGVAARFQFGTAKSAVSRSSVGARDVEGARAVRAIYMAEQIHPLLAHPLMMVTLNEAASRQPHGIPASFEAIRIRDLDSPSGPSFGRFAR